MSSRINTRDREADDLLAASISSDDVPTAQVSLALLAKAKRGDDAALHELVARDQERLEQFTQLLCQRGFEVPQRFGDDVQLVVLGQNPINDAGDGFIPVAELPEYAAATQRGIPVVTLIDFLAANDIPSAMPR